MSDATISAAGLRIMKLLVGNPPQTISDLAKIIGVTRTAVTEQLNELMAAGFVEQNTERQPGRGRPRFRYKATDAALVLLFASNQCLVVPAIWRAIREAGGEKLTAQILQRVGLAMAEHYNRQITAKKPHERLRQLIDVLAEEGCLIEAVEGPQGQLVLYRRSCPFISMVDEQRNVCNIDRDVLSKVVGRPVRKTACRHEGDPCCAIEIVGE
jgi:DeoR family transcriptional regulator, suf operon transcriptional repressor